MKWKVAEFRLDGEVLLFFWFCRGVRNKKKNKCASKAAGGIFSVYTFAVSFNFMS